jgi:PAS domain S-box-containing protein
LCRRLPGRASCAATIWHIRVLAALGLVADPACPRNLPRLIDHADQLKSDARFAVLADTMPQMVWSTLPDGFHDYYNARWYEFTGVPPGSTNGEAWNGMFHPEDQARAWDRWRHSLATGEAYEIEYRLRHHSGEYRWTLGRALPLRDEQGVIVRWYGTCTDIHAAKQLEQERTLVANELSHRIKNIFAVISGLIHLSARSFPEAKGFADALRERVGALGRAHDFVRPHSPLSRRPTSGTSLFAMLAELLAAYQDGNRIVFKGDDTTIDDRSATPLGLVFHELATNAAKYGALSTPAGRVVVASRRDGGQQVLTWTETGGPAVTAPQRTGFGSNLTRISVEGQLGGKLDYDWRSEGLALTLTLPRSAMSR